MAIVMVVTMALLVVLVRERFRAQATADLSLNLRRSVIAFRDLQQDRFDALERENSLLASLPTLKALMTSGDDLTIQDGAVEYWQLSGEDLLALTTPNGRVISVYSKVPEKGTNLPSALSTLVAQPARRNIVDGKTLYACSVRPIYFGSDVSGTILGYVISGMSIERSVRQISAPAGAEAAFLSGGRVVTSTLSASAQQNLIAQLGPLSGASLSPAPLALGGDRYMAAVDTLSSVDSSPLQLVVLKSVRPTEKWIARTDRIVLSAGLIAVLVGAICMVILGRVLTRPLEELSRSVRAFGAGDGAYRVPRYGTREVRHLSSAFARMREETQRANQARLESERLATIGLMASSVSHDLRHYLAAVYANAEFLASDTLPPDERAEIFADIRSAVLGTADMIESLLIFSRTGSSVRYAEEKVVPILEHALSLVRAHPDSQHAIFEKDFCHHEDLIARVDGKQVERAVYNLLLNACQAGLIAERVPHVQLSLRLSGDFFIVRCVDNGNGVPEAIRMRLFDPFVSEGKQKGTGLGLTLANCIAEEHGGEVVLVSSSTGETIFEIRMLISPSAGPGAADANQKGSHALVH
ncbi:periplasmic sensor signal transduction histidine kinase [Granulicella sibirica]|uniref:histidine kinase n=2 Tax=Granulicella sibirica TaxID=2479048 RepID=A0A4Q0SXQ0_9BACT|nr:periplasmic sensor signal transduction histidine kinase [Granulicella sibirica]